MPVHECLRKTPYRHFLAWMYKLDQEWNRPNRTEHYLMQIDASVRRSSAKHPRQVKMKDSKIEFVTTAERRKKRNQEQATQQAKQRWCMAVGIDTNGEPLDNPRHRRQVQKNRQLALQQTAQQATATAKQNTSNGTGNRPTTD